jgi:hypothetical protein
VLNSSLSSAAPLAQQPCAFNGSNHSQWWSFPWTDDLAGHLMVNYHSAFCAEPQSASTVAGTALLQAACLYTGDNHGEDWYSAPSNVSGWVLIVNVHSGLCAHVAGGSTASGARLDQQPCNGATPSMIWQIVGT